MNRVLLFLVLALALIAVATAGDCRFCANRGCGTCCRGDSAPCCDGTFVLADDPDLSEDEADEVALLSTQALAEIAAEEHNELANDQDAQPLDEEKELEMTAEENQAETLIFRRIGRALRRAARAVGRVAKRVGRAVGKAAKKVGKAAKKVGRAVGKAARAVGKAVGKVLKAIGKLFAGIFGVKKVGEAPVPLGAGGRFGNNQCYSNCEYFYSMANKQTASFDNPYQICTACKYPVVVYPMSKQLGRCYTFPQDFGILNRADYDRIAQLCQSKGRCVCSYVPLKSAELGVFSKISLFARRHPLGTTRTNPRTTKTNPSTNPRTNQPKTPPYGRKI